MHDFISKNSQKYPKYPNIELFLLLLLGGGTIGVSNIRILEWKIINIALSVKYRQGRKMVNIIFSLWKLSIIGNLNICEEKSGEYWIISFKIFIYQISEWKIVNVGISGTYCTPLPLPLTLSLYFSLTF